jgi:hypothetical protein
MQGCLVHMQALHHLDDMHLLHHVNMEGTQLLDATTNQPPTADLAQVTDQLTSAFDGVRALTQFVIGPAGKDHYRRSFASALLENRYAQGFDLLVITMQGQCKGYSFSNK